MNQKIKTLQTIHLALVAGLIIAYIIIGEIYSLDKITIPSIDSSNMIYLLIPFGAYIVSNLIFKRILHSVKKKEKLEDNMVHYQTALIIRYAIIEGTTFVLLFIFPEFILFGILLIIYLLLLRPTLSKMERDLNII